jgi:hypothetical protein
VSLLLSAIHLGIVFGVSDRSFAFKKNSCRIAAVSGLRKRREDKSRLFQAEKYTQSEAHLHHPRINIHKMWREEETRFDVDDGQDTIKKSTRHCVSEFPVWLCHCTRSSLRRDAITTEDGDGKKKTAHRWRAKKHSASTSRNVIWNEAQPRK